jgi:flagellin-like protein
MSGIKTFNKKSRKGISPVIATVILVAVAVVIAAALAGFSSSLFGTYSSQGAAVNVKSLEVQSDGDFSLDMVNNGNTRDEVVSISVPPNAAVSDATWAGPGGAGELLPHQPLAAALQGTLTLDPSTVEGSTITVKVNMLSGVQLTQSVIVGPVV